MTARKGTDAKPEKTAAGQPADREKKGHSDEEDSSVHRSVEELAARPQQPLKRKRVVSKALRAYAQSVSSADKGGVRIID